MHSARNWSGRNCVCVCMRVFVCMCVWYQLGSGNGSGQRPRKPAPHFRTQTTFQARRPERPSHPGFDLLFKTHTHTQRQIHCVTEYAEFGRCRWRPCLALAIDQLDRSECLTLCCRNTTQPEQNAKTTNACTAFATTTTTTTTAAQASPAQRSRAPRRPNEEAIYFRNFKLVHTRNGHGLRRRRRAHVSITLRCPSRSYGRL